MKFYRKHSDFPPQSGIPIKISCRLVYNSATVFLDMFPEQMSNFEFKIATEQRKSSFWSFLKNQMKNADCQ